MRIQKIGHQSSKHSKTFSLSKAEDNPVFGADSGDDSDDFELNELCCELGLVEGQLCSIPYELFDLPDLREILSLDTWNSSLTEEERFYLSAYLPDMDQQTFCLTMKELFDGSDLYFGNPLDVFFKRLRGGFYPPKVAHLRECLQFIQRKKYYHSLRSYHDRMTQMFTDMRRMWDQYEMSPGVEERILMWKNKRKQRAINLLDLNKFPKDDHLLSEEVSLHMKGLKPVEQTTEKDVLPSLSASEMKFASNCRAKGFLKIKVSGNGLLPNHNPKIIGSDVSEQCRSVPKGLLKIVPKVTSVQLEQSEVVQRGAQSTFLVRDQGLLDFKFSSLPAYVHLPDAGGLHESPFLRQKVDGGRLHSTLNQPHCLLNQQDCNMRTCHHSEPTRKIERQIIPSSDDISVLGKHTLLAGDVRRDPNEEFPPMYPMGARKHPFGVESLGPNLHKGTEDFSLRSLESYPFGIQYHRRQQRIALMKDEHITVYPRILEAVPRTSAICNVKQEVLMASSSNPMRSERLTLVRKNQTSY
ncbi:hypothetical protein GH714_038168 [Hevea brasiliensis]|uniref:DEUBAD domain-containing protein n=1 Tax=Hevea brasiliensis TaxID=3981 RepID=A0A6A6MR94_HEVBR|nr:hypothetical protein GH714_038168 [Hevea brasiliensis]